MLVGPCVRFVLPYQFNECVGNVCIMVIMVSTVASRS